MYISLAGKSKSINERYLYMRNMKIGDEISKDDLKQKIIDKVNALELGPLEFVKVGSAEREEKVG